MALPSQVIGQFTITQTFPSLAAALLRSPRTPQGQPGRGKQKNLTLGAGIRASAPVVRAANEKHTRNANINIVQSTTLFHHLRVLTRAAKKHTLINKHALICTQLHSHPPIPPGQGLLGVCTEIGHLSHMMSRGRGCIIDEPKQHVSVSTQHTVGRRRKQQEVLENSSGRGYLDVGQSGENHRRPRWSSKNQEAAPDRLIRTAPGLFSLQVFNKCA